MTGKSRTIDEYIARWSSDKRAALQKIRRTIQAAAPEAEECIAYDIPGFRLEGRLLISFGAAAKHCALYPGVAPIQAHKAALAVRPQQGHDPFPSGPSDAGRAGAEAGEGLPRASCRPKRHRVARLQAPPPSPCCSHDVLNDTDQFAALPSGLSGDVLIRVVDTARTPGHQSLDSVLIDEIWIRSIP